MVLGWRTRAVAADATAESTSSSASDSDVIMAATTTTSSPICEGDDSETGLGTNIFSISSGEQIITAVTESAVECNDLNSTGLPDGGGNADTASETAFEDGDLGGVGQSSFQSHDESRDPQLFPPLVSSSAGGGQHQQPSNLAWPQSSSHHHQL